MAYGANKNDEMLKNAWERFCDELKAAGSRVLDDPAPSTDLDRAVGFQYLSQNISLGLDTALEYNDPLFPHFFRVMTPTRKYGGDNPDCLYLRALIDGRHMYRVVGNRGGVHYLAFSAYRPAENLKPGESAEVGRVLGSELQSEWDGSFELILSPDEHPGNWIKTTPDTHQLTVRQFFGDWAAEEPVSVRIERVGAEGAPAPLTPERLARGLQGAAEWVTSTADYWRNWQERYRADANTLMTSATQARVGAAPGGTIYHMYWVVQPDEALIIEFVPPACDYWEFELNNYWMTSVDYRYLLSSTNCKLATLEEGGSARVVVSHEDPGVPNWLATGGHSEGHIGLRWMQCDEAPIPKPRLVKFKDLASALPANARRIDEVGRREQLRLRRIGVDRRFRV